MMIQKNSPAPYAGVLIPEEHYRDMMVDIYASDKFEQQMVDCSIELATLEINSKFEKTYYVMGGALGIVLLELFVWSLVKR